MSHRQRYAWYGYVKSMLRRYPEYHARLQDLKSMPSVPAGSGTHSGKISDPTAALALRELPRVEQQEHDAVFKALQTIKGWKGGELQIRILELCYFKKTHSLTGAALKLNISYSYAVQLHIQALRLVARNFGLYDGPV